MEIQIIQERLCMEQWNIGIISNDEIQFVYYLKIQKMTMMTYQNFLNDAYKRILEACLADEAINTLRNLENSEYLLLRINQLFTEIYVAERQNKIQSLIDEINTLKDGKLKVNENKLEQCNDCLKHKEKLVIMMRDHQRQIACLSAKNQKIMTQQHRSQFLLEKQNDQMKEFIRKLQLDIGEKQREYSLESNKMKEINSELKTSNLKQKQAFQKIKTQSQAMIKELIQEKKKLQFKLMAQIQKYVKEESLRKELQSKLSSIKITNQTISSQLKASKDQRAILQQKILRIQNQNRYYIQTKDKLQKEIKELKSTLQQSQLNRISKQCNLSTELVPHQSVSKQILDQLTKSEEKQQQLQRQVISLQNKLQSQNYEFKETIAAQETQISDLSQQLKRLQIKFQREVRLKQEEAESRIQQSTRNYEQSLKEYKEKMEKRLFYELKERQNTLSKNNQQIAHLMKKIVSSQSLIHELNEAYKEKVEALEKQIHQNELTQKKLEKAYKNEKNDDHELTKELKMQIQSLKHENNQLRLRQKAKVQEIQNLHKSMNDELQKHHKINIANEESLKNLTSYKYQIVENQKEIKELKYFLKDREKQIKQMQSKLQKVTLTLNQKDETIETKKKKIAKLEEQLKSSEKQLIQSKQSLIQIQQANKQELIQSFQKSQKNIEESRMQIQNHYQSLLKQSQNKGSYLKSSQMLKEKNTEIKELKALMELLQQKLEESNETIKAKNEQKRQNDDTISNLQDKTQKLSTDLKHCEEQLREQKRKYVSLVKIHHNKLSEYSQKFTQFKYEFYVSLKEALQTVKDDCILIRSMVQKQKSHLNTIIHQAFDCFTINVNKLQQNQQSEIEKIKKYYETIIIPKLEDEKKELISANDRKLKEKSIQVYTILAQKEFQIKSYTENEEKISKSLKDLSIKLKNTEKQLKDQQIKTEQFKKIITKMDTKVNQAEREGRLSNSELNALKNENFELKKSIATMQASFRQKIEKCRQKYSQQNEKIFKKYEQEFSKFIVSNKKSLQYSMLSNSCSNLQIPTKGANNDSKLQRIQKQIQDQKRKINLLQTTKLDKKQKIPDKLQKPNKITSERDSRQIRRKA